MPYLSSKGRWFDDRNKNRPLSWGLLRGTRQFWEFISGDNNLYTDIIEPLGHQAKEKNEQFMQEYAKVINKFTAEFIGTFCDTDGSILWEEIVKFNSAGTTS